MRPRRPAPDLTLPRPRRQLDCAEVVGWVAVDVEPESGLFGVERPCPVDVADERDDDFDLVVMQYLRVRLRSAGRRDRCGRRCTDSDAPRFRRPIGRFRVRRARLRRRARAPRTWLRSQSRARRCRGRRRSVASWPSGSSLSDGRQCPALADVQIAVDAVRGDFLPWLELESLAIEGDLDTVGLERDQVPDRRHVVQRRAV
jgi:hypothetical protein